MPARRTLLGLVGLLTVACVTSTAGPLPTSSPRPRASASTSAVPQVRPTGLEIRTLAVGLEIPWALAFARDGSIWFTERPGRVRVYRRGKLLPHPALTLPVVASPGCEGGMLGIAIAGTDAYVFYTYAGESGNLNRISRFGIQGDHLTGEEVVLDGISGGDCNHDGGRLKIGPDGALYATTGEGFVASRAADPNNLSGKILRLSLDVPGHQVVAWGFRNPQGITFGPGDRLYASNNGPTGEFGLCCHDEIDLISQGGFYGWPAFAALVPTGYSRAGLPDRIAPLVDSGDQTWAPSGIAYLGPANGDLGGLYVAELRGQELRHMRLDPAGRVTAQDVVLGDAGRLREVVPGPDNCLYVLTSNRDGRGSPGPDDDRLIQLCPR